MSEKMFEEAWQYAMNELKEEYIAQNRESEFVFNFNMSYVEDDGSTITVSVASAFLQQMMQQKKSFEIIQNKIRKITGLNNLQIKSIIVSESSEEVPASKTAGKELLAEKSAAPEAPVKKKKHNLLQEEFTFDTFISGENSDYAYKAALAVAKNPGKKYNPILIYGSSGLGKTHLMQAIGNYIYENNNEKIKIYYGSAESFTNEFTNSLKSKKIDEFKSKYRNLDLLLLDDIHFLDNKAGIQEELFYTFNALHDKQAQMVFTCDRPIKEIKNMTDRLVSRISSGLCIDITIPNYETRYAILLKKIELMGKTLNPEIIDYIASNVETNVRELESALKKVFGYIDLIGEEESLNLDTVKDQLKDLIKPEYSNTISLDVIQRVIAENYQIKLADLKSESRSKKFVIPRHIAIYIARELTEISYTEIGEEFGGKDHSTIMAAYNKIANQIKLDADFNAKIQLLIKEIKEYKNR